MNIKNSEIRLLINFLTGLNPSELDFLAERYESASALQSAIEGANDAAAVPVPGTVIGATRHALELPLYLVIEAYYAGSDDGADDGVIPDLPASHPIGIAWNLIKAELAEISASFQYRRPVGDDGDYELGHYLPGSSLCAAGSEYSTADAELVGMTYADFEMPFLEALPYAKALGIDILTGSIPAATWASESYSDEPTTYELHISGCSPELAAAITAWLKA